MSTGVPPTLLRSRTCDNPFSPLASLNPTQRLHTYIGNDLVLYWVIDVPPGTLIQYNVTDSGGAHINSTALTVQPNPILSSISLLSTLSAQSLASVSSVSVTSHSSTSSQTSTNPQPTSTQSKTSGFSSPTQTSSGGGNSTFSISTSLLASISSASVVSTNSTGALPSTNSNPTSTSTAISNPSAPTQSPSSRRHGTWAIAVGVSVVLLLLGLGAFFLIRRRKGRSKEKDDAFESPHTIYPHVHAPVVTQNTSVDVVPPLYPNDVFAPSAFRGTAGSMMTAPTNSDEVYYNRVVMGGSGGYLRANDTSS
ncbi:uncharacterized protein EI90DRAFT_3076399 [Cantharellus anzutake]|uniref:uncharacterized protein n=1 Tax=Cantharellus anzutake TaxID=1750568 RepID=UPI001908116F|nr:uncharacterized protein EI90DRAFT_3076399 [Cantharellus anzutake]KAF8324225.1 hypothetical protein EI90DRAFT_3076399 [Cantharellus anzutake]